MRRTSWSWKVVGILSALIAMSCEGPAGPQGAQGAAGEAGPTGAAGPSGPIGPSGQQGATGPQGSAGPTGSQGATGPQGAIGPQGAPGLGLSSGLKVSVLSVTSFDGGVGPISVRFKVMDDRNNPVDLAGNYSINTVKAPSFSISNFTTDTTAAKNVLPYNVMTVSGNVKGSAPDAGAIVMNPTAFTPTWPIPAAGVPATDAAMKGLLVENGTGFGDYTYTFPTGGLTSATASGVTTITRVGAVAYDSTKAGLTHTLWIQLTRQTDLVNTTAAATFSSFDAEYNFVPNGSAAPGRRQLVATSQCSKCHSGFRPQSNTALAFHGGGRIEANYCNVCHNPARTTNPDANSARFVHRIHFGKHLQASTDGGVNNLFHGLAVTYPQDIRNCGTCHDNSLQAKQYLNRPSVIACGSCHDGVDFTGTLTNTCSNTAPVKDAEGKLVPCAHNGGPQSDDSLCVTCHGPARIEAKHLAVLPPDPNAWTPSNTTGNKNTNAAYMTAAGEIPVTATVITYAIKSVSTYVDTDGGVRPQMTFKLQSSVDGGAPVDVNFGTYDATNNKEIMPGFVGSPSAYFVWAVPQDGVNRPADFNASTSCYIKDAWVGSGLTLTGANLCTIESDTANPGYYLVKMTNVNLPADIKDANGNITTYGASMLTGGVGYSYALDKTRPLTQTNLPAYSYDTTTMVGGLLVPAADVTKVADGYTGRRAIVENARCKNCHAQLGAGPTFHAGQRNDGPTCSWCHTPNRTSSGWAAGSKYFIHAIHGADKRSTPFTWHSVSLTENFAEVEFPSPLNKCSVCHVPGMYDFSNAAAAAAVSNMFPNTVAQRPSATQTLYNADPVTNPTGYYSISPYVDASVGTHVGTDYGVGFSVKADTGAVTPAASTTLVISPIMTACSACHDTKPAIAHMETNGGSFYKPRSQAAQNVEQCLICHGPGTIAPIGVLHQ